MAASRYTAIGSGSYKGHAYVVYIYPTPFGNYGYCYTVDGSNVANDIFYGGDSEDNRSEAVKRALQKLEEQFGPDRGKPDPKSVQDKGAYKTFKDSDGTFGFQTPSTGLIKTGYTTRQGAGIAARSAVEAAARKELDRLGIDAGGRATEQLLALYEGNARRIYDECSQEVSKKFNRMMQDGGYLGKRMELRKLVDAGQMTQEELEHAMSLWYAEFNRLWNMSEQMSNVLMDAEKEAAKVLNGMLADGYVANGAFGMFQVEGKASVEGVWGLPDKATVQRLIRDGNHELVKEVKPKVAKSYEWSRRKFNAAITQGVMQGESIPEITKRVQQVIGMDRRSALRAARTAMTNAQNAGRIDSYRRARSMGIDVMNEWEATLDNRTRISHRHMMGERVEVGEKFSNGLRYPADPNGAAAEVYNCRCTLIPYVSGIDYDRSEDWFKHVVVDGVSYEDWLDGKRAIVRKGQAPEATPMTFADRLETCFAPDDVARLMDEQGWWSKDSKAGSTPTNFSGIDVRAARKVAEAYHTIFERYPQLVGKFHAPNANPSIGERTYAWCYFANGFVELNPKHFGDWSKLAKDYVERDVAINWHPKGTTAESIVVHELGHAIDGLMRRFTASEAFEQIAGNVALDENLLREWGDYRKSKYPFSTALRQRVMKKATGQRFTNKLVSQELSDYATQDAAEWMAEAFAEYISSPNPRRVAAEFGAELERMFAERDRILAEYAKTKGQKS